MSHKIKAFLVTLATGFLFTILVLVTEASIAKVYLHPFAVAMTIVLWFFFSIISWEGFFKGVPQGEPFLSPRLFKSLVIGLTSVLVILGSMLLLGRMGGYPPLAITEFREINAAGVIFIWVLIAGLLFEGIFNPNKRISK